MPALMLINNKANEELARLIAADNPGCEVQVDNWYVVIECPGELRVSVEHAWKAWAGTSIVQDPEWFLWEWQAVLRGCTGHIVRRTENEVVFSDNPPPKQRGGRALNVIIAADLWERLDRATKTTPGSTKREIVEAALNEYLRAHGL